jgi:nucleotide-binding universal stress UspA family protein
LPEPPASAALNGAACSIAVAPTNYSQQPRVLREIGVGYDGSPQSAHALSVARRLVGASGAKLSALEAVSLPSAAFLPSGAVDNTPRRLLEDARARIAALGDVEPRAAYGQPAEELGAVRRVARSAARRLARLRPVGRLIHGSISQQLAAQRPLSALVLTRTAHPGATDQGADHGREGCTSSG